MKTYCSKNVKRYYYWNDWLVISKPITGYLILIISVVLWLSRLSSSLLQSHWKRSFKVNFHSKSFLLLQEPGTVPHICASLEDNITASISSIGQTVILAYIFCLPCLNSQDKPVQCLYSFPQSQWWSWKLELRYIESSPLRSQNYNDERR